MRLLHQILFLFWVGSSLAGLCQASGDEMRGRSTAEEMRSRLSYLDKNGSLQNYLRIDAEGIAIFASANDKYDDRPEFRLYPSEYRAFQGMVETLNTEELLAVYRRKGIQRWPATLIRQYSSTPFWRPGRDPGKPLAGFRVALDPGHLGGSMEEAELEGKYVKVRPSTTYQGMWFWEGNLTLATAHLVRQKLEQLGATVFMTRERPGQTAMGPLYSAWRQNDFLPAVDQEVRQGRMSQSKARFWKTQATDRDIYRRFFTILDLRERAERINAFKPHITLIIHYNVDKENWDKRDKERHFTPGFANYSMAFVPGNLSTGNLRTQAGRLNFLRLLATSHAAESIRLSALYLEANTLTTGVPVVDQAHEPDYLQNFCLQTPAPGVYARDLALTRLIESPLCYGESLCQDNWRELLWLNKQDIMVAGIPTSSRVQYVAEAYVLAVKKYVGIP